VGEADLILKIIPQDAGILWDFFAGL